MVENPQCTRPRRWWARCAADRGAAQRQRRYADEAADTKHGHWEGAVPDGSVASSSVDAQEFEGFVGG